MPIMQHETRAWALMALGTVLFALVPATYAVGVNPTGNDPAPALFVSILVGTAVPASYLTAGGQRLHEHGRTLLRTYRESWLLLTVGVLANFERMIYAVALGLAGPWITATLFGAWPTAMTILSRTVPAFGTIRKRQKPTVGLWFALAVAMTGAGVMLHGAHGTATTGTWKLLLGGGLALLAGGLSGLYVSCNRTLSLRASMDLEQATGDGRPWLCEAATYGTIKAPLTVALGTYAMHEIIQGHERWQTPVALWAIGGGIAIVAASLLFRIAHRLSQHDGINALTHLGPACAIGWIAAAGAVTGVVPSPHWPSVLIGLAIIIGGNALAYRATRQ